LIKSIQKNAQLIIAEAIKIDSRKSKRSDENTNANCPQSHAYSVLAANKCFYTLVYAMFSLSRGISTDGKEECK
jgi:hypothetical protein